MKYYLRSKRGIYLELTIWTKIGSTPLAGEDDFSCLEEALISSSPDSSLLPSSTLITGSALQMSILPLHCSPLIPMVLVLKACIRRQPTGGRRPVESSLAATTIEWTTPRTDSNPEFCERPCPDRLLRECPRLPMALFHHAYATGLGNCQAIPNGDMISELDIEANFDGIQALMAAFKFPSHNFYVNGFMGDLNRKKARVVYISATTSLMTRNVNDRSKRRRSEGYWNNMQSA
ncbi:hypothetical protein PRIPAC_85721, partial [Pristionchus pacificus]|uniref:Uncharacterized protein n=1 Tax=Pristionchus pacificus TaxID=54126 RepID=A0A2A6BYM7_PRIPA